MKSMVVDTTFTHYRCILSDILKKLGFATMAVSNLHIRNKYICEWFQIVFILIKHKYGHHFGESVMHTFDNIE